MFSKRLTAVLLGSVLCAAPAMAADYPTKTITMICPYSAGGGGDTATRMIAKLAGDLMGVNINVENKTGGGATIGINAAARAEPDGYTLTFISTSPITIRPHMTKAPYDPIKDLTYVGQFVASNQPLVVKADSPFQTLADLLAYGRDNPGKLRWSTSVQRGGPHLAVEAMFNQENIKATYIPFKGGSKTLAALLGGTIDMAMIDEGSKATLDKQTRIPAEGTPNKNPVAPGRTGADRPWLPDRAGDFLRPGRSGVGLPKPVLDKWTRYAVQGGGDDEFKALARQQNWTLDYLPQRQIHRAGPQVTTNWPTRPWIRSAMK
ncbi:MAG: tripartite tricarboxylate transporter substrate binding protein [Burkholderiaceae bacterium]